MRLQSLLVPCEDYSIACLRYVPATTTARFTTILVHGYTAGKYSMDGLASYLCLRGLECLTMDLAGHKLGASGGRMATPQVAAANILSVIRAFCENLPQSEYVLCGHSLGAAACLSAISYLRETDVAPTAVIAMAMGEHPAKGFQSVIGRKMLEQRGDHVSGATAEEFVGQLEEFVELLTPITCPALFVAAGQDVLLPVTRVQALANRLRPGSDYLEVNSSHMDLPDAAKASVYAWLQKLADEVRNG